MTRTKVRLIIVLTALASLLIGGTIAWQFKPDTTTTTTSATTFACSWSPDDYCANLYGAIRFGANGNYYKQTELNLTRDSGPTDRLRLSVSCIPVAHRASSCQPGTQASIRWSAKPGTPVVWFGAFPDAPRRLGGQVGRYDFTVGTLGTFEVYGQDTSEKRIASSIPGGDGIYPAHNTRVTGPPVSGPGVALIQEDARFKRAPAWNTKTGDACKQANVYYSVDYSVDGGYTTGATRSLRAESAMDSSAILAGTTSPPAGRDLNWRYAKGVKPLGLTIGDWNNNFLTYSQFPAGLTLRDKFHTPRFVRVCAYDPSPAPKTYHY